MNRKIALLLIICFALTFVFVSCKDIKETDDLEQTEATETPQPPEELEGLSDDENVSVTPEEVSASEETIFGENDKDKITNLLSAYPQNIDSKYAVENGMFVLVHGIVEPDSQQAWDDFYSAIQNGQNAAVIIMQYTVEGDPILA